MRFKSSILFVGKVALHSSQHLHIVNPYAAMEMDPKQGEHEFPVGKELLIQMEIGLIELNGYLEYSREFNPEHPCGFHDCAKRGPDIVEPRVQWNLHNPDDCVITRISPEMYAGALHTAKEMALRVRACHNSGQILDTYLGFVSIYPLPKYIFVDC